MRRCKVCGAMPGEQHASICSVSPDAVATDYKPTAAEQRGAEDSGDDGYTSPPLVPTKTYVMVSPEKYAAMEAACRACLDHPCVRYGIDEAASLLRKVGFK